MARTTSGRHHNGTAVLDRPRDAAVIPLDRIRQGTNLRDNLQGIDELAESIRSHGVLTAVLVTRREDGDYDLDAGYRRVAAATAAGLGAVPAVVRDPVSALQRIDDQLAENGDRLGLTDLDMAGAMQQMLDLGASSKDVGRRFECAADTVERWRGILALPAALRDRIRDGILSADDAGQLVPLLDEGDTLNAVVAEIEAGASPGWAIRRVRSAHDLAQREAGAREKLAAENCAIVDAPKWGIVSTNSKLQRLGEGVRVAPRKHRKLPCHAAFIDHSGNAVYVCTNRAVHAGEEGSGVPDLKALRAEKRAQRQALKEGHAKRKEALRPILDGVLPDPVLTTRHLLHLMIQDADRRVRALICEQLGMEPDGGAWYGGEVRALLQYIGEDDERLRQVALLVAVTRGEHSLTEDKGRYETGYVARAHLPFVARAVGYEPVAVEENRAAERGRSGWGSVLPSFLGGEPEATADEGDTDEESPIA